MYSFMQQDRPRVKLGHSRLVPRDRIAEESTQRTFRPRAAFQTDPLPTLCFPVFPLTLFPCNFILVVRPENDPACLYLPAFPVRSLACQTRFQPEREGYSGRFKDLR